MAVAVLGSALRGGGVQIVDVLLETMEQDNILIYDDDVESHGNTVLGVKIAGSIEQAIIDAKENILDGFVIAIGSTIPRRKVYERVMASDIEMLNIISKRAIVSSYSKLGCGNVILPNVYIGPNTEIGNNNYITTGTQINHDSTVGSHCYFSAGVIVAGRVTIGDSCRFDTSSCITADAIVESCTLIAANCSHGPIRDI